VQRPRPAARISCSEESARGAGCTILAPSGEPIPRAPSAPTDWRTPINATAERPLEGNEGELRCYNHPNTPTRLRCNRCGKAICTRCATPTPVGLRCPDCARGPRPVMYQTDASILARAVGGGIAAAVVIGVAWGFLNNAGLGRFGRGADWGFWFTLLLGFGVAEAISWLANRRRGPNLQVIGIASVLLGFVISRVVLNARSLRPLPLDQLLSQPQTLGIDMTLILFVALACVIAWRRFR
jgi:hypothetical protein